MGLDIYAGTLTRYYSHNWKNRCPAVGGEKWIYLQPDYPRWRARR